MKYEVPTMEIVKFEFKNNILTASVYIGGGTENQGGENKDPIATFPGGEDDFDPFA